MHFNFYAISVTVPAPRDDDRPDIMWSDILRVGDCSEVDVAGNLFKEESTGKLAFAEIQEHYIPDFYTVKMSYDTNKYFPNFDLC